MLRRVLLVLILAISSAVWAQRGPSVSPARKRALVIGVGETSGFAKLAFADKDAEGFAATLESDLEFAPGEVRLLTTAGGAPPTRATVLSTLDEQLSDPSIQKGELFVIFFSGHGVGRKTGDYLVTAEAHEPQIEGEGLRVSELLARITARGIKNVLLVTDACRSGDKSTFGSDLISQARKANVALMMGCAPGSRSYESADLGQGIFTHFLRRAIADDRNLDEYGALWTSQIADQVGKRVKSFTQADYPSDPQLPAGWTDRARDVMLRVTPRVLTAAQLTALAGNPKALTPEMYRASVETYAQSLFQAGSYEACIRLLKIVDASGGANASTLMTLADCLLLSGRDGEASAIYSRLARDPDPYIASLAILRDHSALISGEERMRAARNLWTLKRDRINANAVMDAVEAEGTTEQYLQVIEDVRRALPTAGRFAQILDARVALFRNDLPGTVKAWERAANLASHSPDDDQDLESVLFDLLPMIEGRADFDRLVQLYNDAGPTRMRMTVYAGLLANRGEREESLRVAIEASQDPTIQGVDMAMLLQAVGYDAFKLAPGFEALAKRRPLEWDVQLYARLARLLDPSRKVEGSLLNSAILAGSDDDLTVLSTAYPILELAVSDGIARGHLPRAALPSLLIRFAEDLKPQVPKFGRSGRYWAMLARYCLFTQQTTPIARLFREWVAIQRDDDWSMRQARLEVALVNGNETEMRRVWNGAQLLEPGRSDMGWGYAMALWARGHADEARGVLKTLRHSHAFSKYEPISRLVIEGDPVKIAAVQPEDGFESQVLGIVYARRGEWEKAEPLLRAALKNQALYTLVVTGEAFRLLSARYRITGDRNGLVEIAHFAATRYFGNPIFADLSPLLKPETSGYAGLYGGSSTILWSDRSQPVEFKAQAFADGRFEGELKSEDGAVERITGRFDANGNLNAQTRIAGQRFAIYGKLIPISIYDDAGVPHEEGQSLALEGPLGQSGTLVVRMRPAPAP